MYNYNTDQLTELFKIYYESVLLSTEYSFIGLPANHVAKFILWLKEENRLLLIKH